MRPSRAKVAAAFAAIYLLWGATFLAIRYAVAEVPPMLTIAVRCLGGAALLYLWLLLRGERPSTAPRQWRTALVAGVFLFLGCHSLLAWAEQRVSSGEAALLMTSIPLWLVLLSSLRERRTPPAPVLAGLALGVIGVAVLTVGQGGGSTADRLWLILSALAWAVGSLVARHGARPASAVESTAMQLAAGGLVVLLASGLAGELGAWRPAETSARGAASLAFLVVGGTVLGFGAFTWLLQVTTPAAVGTYAFVNPVVALLLAWMAGDGELTARVLVGAGIVVAAVVLTWSGSTLAARRLRAEAPAGSAPPAPARAAAAPPAAAGGGILPAGRSHAAAAGGESAA
ncbi:MAG TPA: EamA family transporter [Gemmatimonadales bacterium]|nr:EamA family transporter [Gemmatimonadales bacterium]